METYMAILGLLVLTALTVLVVAGCGFLLLAMWTAVQERL